MPLNLDTKREERLARRAAAVPHEATGDGEPIIFHGREVAVLPPELPFGVIAPLRAIDDEIALLLRQALRMQQGGSAVEGASLVLDLLSTNADLPQTLVTVVHEMATALLGADGLQAFLDASPSVPDIAALVGGVFGYYGLALGESSRSADSSPSGGPTSEPISDGSTGSTPTASTDAQETPGAGSE